MTRYSNGFVQVLDFVKVLGPALPQTTMPQCTTVPCSACPGTPVHKAEGSSALVCRPTASRVSLPSSAGVDIVRVARRLFETVVNSNSYAAALFDSSDSKTTPPMESAGFVEMGQAEKEALIHAVPLDHGGGLDDGDGDHAFFVPVHTPASSARGIDK
ncbi:predicted protein [Chaetomium globosum CBS 148.51]|uniref:Uncharacterized protein n=1 Tax=Chaetomium globosum (strain ATCC 6205 / CBS 148.51 / DSM 1962 / NBRC 6347 / NRRL 1970) TaxID=306901 RepID=Q2H5T5_CHAGB|nr:uncharacterized protein CHGG_05980 [Chaetomium globosum CBS 148.51]EAQ89361.1 predicted protein [Chaetomium globosum CBS 148.51]